MVMQMQGSFSSTDWDPVIQALLVHLLGEVLRTPSVAGVGVSTTCCPSMSFPASWIGVAKIATIGRYEGNAVATDLAFRLGITGYWVRTPFASPNFTSI